ncbi:MAG: hypothetical protein U9R57_01755 [Thermodesulfobacteriota bacterium]|nr:hypothetical protein [Thermodesulfobacteriota bacterium]
MTLKVNKNGNEDDNTQFLLKDVLPGRLDQDQTINGDYMYDA